MSSARVRCACCRESLVWREGDRRWEHSSEAIRLPWLIHSLWPGKDHHPEPERAR